MTGVRISDYQQRALLEEIGIELSINSFESSINTPEKENRYE